MASEWDTIRLPFDVVRQLAAQSPAALAVLCRVLHHCRHEPRQCWASVERLSTYGERLSPASVRAALSLLCTQRLLVGQARRRATTVYSPTERVPFGERGGVHVPMEAWYTLPPRELAFYAVRIALGRGLAARSTESAEEVGAQVRGPRGTVSRATAYRIQARLLRLGLLEHRPVSRRSPSLKTTTAKSQNTLPFVSNQVSTQIGEKLSEHRSRIPPDPNGGAVKLPIEAAASWVGVKFRRAQERAMEPQVQPAEPRLVEQFAELRKIAGPALGLCHAAKTATGLPQIKETKLAHQWCELTDQARADLPLLGAYIAAGGFRGLRVPVWAWIADRLLESLCRARAWHEAGRPSFSISIKTVPEDESLYDTWAALLPSSRAKGVG